MNPSLATVTKQQRISMYDWLRLFATIYVVIGHSTYLTISSLYGGISYQMPANTSFLELTQTISGFMYSFHMPLFFMLSGAVLALKPLPSFDTLVRKKARRLLLPFFVCGVFFMIPVKWLGGFYTKDAIFNAVKAFLTNSSETGHLWFLVTLFWCFLIFGFLQKFTHKLGCHSIYLLLFLSGLIFLYGNRLPFDFFGIKSAFQYTLYFTIGYIFEKERNRMGTLRLRNVFLIFMVLVIIVIIDVKYNLLSDLSLILIRSLTTALLAYLCSQWFQGFCDKKPWDFLIRNLFYVYLFHDPLEYVVLRIFFSNNLLQYLPGCLLYQFLRTVGIFLLCLLLGEACEYGKRRIPLFSSHTGEGNC